MRRIACWLVIGMLALGLSGCQSIEAFLPIGAGRLPSDGTCATYEVVDTGAGVVTPDMIEQTRTIIENRITATGVVDTVVFVDDDGRLRMGIPVFAPDDEIMAEIRSLVLAPGVLAFMPVPAELQGLVETGPVPEGMLDQEPLFTGVEIDTAVAAQDATTQELVIDMRLKDTGARLFDEFAAEHFGEQFAVVFDDEVLVAPVIQATRFGGRAQISGGVEGFSMNEIQRMVTLLRFGSLPLEVREVDFGACD